MVVVVEGCHVAESPNTCLLLPVMRLARAGAGTSSPDCSRELLLTSRSLRTC